MMILKDKKRVRVIAFILAMLMFCITILPNVVKGFNLDDYWNYPEIAPSWDENLTNTGLTGLHIDYKKTGMAFNENFYFSVGTAGWSWPLGAQMYLEKRDGYDNTGFENFEMRHTFCTANHASALSIYPGMRAFQSKKYRYTEDMGEMFEPAKKGKTNPKFNFLMLAIACYYPGDYHINKNAGSIVEDSATAQGVVSQAIAWLCTDDTSNGFTGESWDTDFGIFKDSKYYQSMMTSFKNDPAIDSALHAKPADKTGAGEAKMENMAEAWFWDIWNAASLTTRLEADWDKDISKFNIAIKQEDGMYRAENMINTC